MKTQEARDIGDTVTHLITDGMMADARDALFPVLYTHTPFQMLDIIGERIGRTPDNIQFPFLERIAIDRTMGGWIIIASALRRQIPMNLKAALESCCRFVILADVWYATDSFGERVPGTALVDQFDAGVKTISLWRGHANPWIRRMVGVSVHYWAKQAHGDQQYVPHVNILLEMLEPMFSERQIDVVKGTGWGIKTLGKYYPNIQAEWLSKQVARPHVSLMLRKALTYLPDDLRKKVAGGYD